MSCGNHLFLFQILVSDRTCWPGVWPTIGSRWWICDSGFKVRPARVVNNVCLQKWFHKHRCNYISFL